MKMNKNILNNMALKFEFIEFDGLLLAHPLLPKKVKRKNSC